MLYLKILLTAAIAIVSLSIDAFAGCPGGVCPPVETFRFQSPYVRSYSAPRVYGYTYRQTAPIVSYRTVRTTRYVPVRTYARVPVASSVTFSAEPVFSAEVDVSTARRVRIKRGRNYERIKIDR